MKVVVDRVNVDVDRTPVLHDISLTARSGAFVGIVGPNGSGKSTLLRTVYRVTKPHTGRVWVGDRQVWDLSQREAARRVAVLQQADHADFDFTVEEVVGLGRLPHRRIGAAPGSRDRQLVEDAIERCSIGHLRHRFVLSLSGGERQRVLIARAIAQEPEVLVLDEPSNHLDISSQLELLDLISGLGVTVLAALHDLNLALGYCDDVVVLTTGRVTAAGPAAEVLTERLVSEVYGISSWRGVHPGTGRLQLSFARSAETPTAPTSSPRQGEPDGNRQIPESSHRPSRGGRTGRRRLVRRRRRRGLHVATDNRGRFR